MRDRRATPPLSWHDPRRWAWVHGLGFALCVFLALFLVLWVLRTLLPEADEVAFSLPLAFVVASLASCLLTVVLCAVLVFGWMARGANLADPRARTILLLWSASGLLFSLVQVLVLVRFGAVSLPNVAPWISGVYWRTAFVALPAFSLMTWIHAAPTAVLDEEDEVDRGS